MQVGIAGYSPLANDAARRWLSAGFDVLVWDRDPALAAKFPVENEEGPMARAVSSIRELVAQLTPLRRIFLFTNDPQESDATILALAALLEVSDIVVDASDCSHHAADRRMAILANPRARYVGLGILTKEDSNLEHASLLCGGHRVGSEAVAVVLEALVPKSQTAYLGSGGTAQLLKTLLTAEMGSECHLLAEILRLGQTMGISLEEFRTALPVWSQQAVETPLLPATADLLRTGENGNGAAAGYESIAASWRKAAGVMIETGAAVPSFLVGFASDALVISERERETNVSRYPRPAKHELTAAEKASLLDEMRQAFGAARLLATLQVIQLTRQISQVLDYEISVLDCVRVLRNFALSKSALFDPFLTALADPNGTNLFAYPRVQFVLSPMIPGLRRIVAAGFSMGIPLPQCSSCLSYFDSQTAPAWTGPSGSALLAALKNSAVAEPVGRRPGKHK